MVVKVVVEVLGFGCWWWVLLKEVVVVLDVVVGGV